MAFQYNAGVNCDCLALLGNPPKSDLNIMCENHVIALNNVGVTNCESYDVCS